MQLSSPFCRWGNWGQRAQITAQGIQPRQPSSQASASNHHTECLAHAWHTAGPSILVPFLLPQDELKSDSRLFADSKRGSGRNRCLISWAVEPAQQGSKGPSCNHSQQHGTDDRGGKRHGRFPGCDSTSMDWNTCPVMPQEEKARAHSFMGLTGCGPSCYEVQSAFNDMPPMHTNLRPIGIN